MDDPGIVVKMYLLCFLMLILGEGPDLCSAAVASSASYVTNFCEYYNQSICDKSKVSSEEEGCTRREQCDHPGDGKRNHCFVVWTKDDNGTMVITLKGCFLNTEECYNKTECVNKARVPHKNYLFCCCEGDMCNQNFTWDPTPTEPVPVPATPPQQEPDRSFPQIVVITVIGILPVLFCGTVLLFFWYKRKKYIFNELPTMEPHPMSPPSPYLDLRPIQLIEIKARGRFGAVWRAQYKDEVAVKIFPVQDKQSWSAEQEIFKLPYIEHPNILHYIGVEKRGDNLQAEYWLITAYHERGSLCDFLKAHTVTWSELCLIAETMARGLMHLHEAIPGKSPADPVKPAIAHRDFKSKNVLLKNDMTACIADFGLALVFVSGKSCGVTHGQVGTRRYMAPEVLEGAISFTPDSFLRIDMYACGLVLWELVSRCTAQENPIAEYRLPFEEEVGPHPTLEDMQEAVVQRKVRPTILDNWRNHPGLSTMCDTMEECWDHDAEARLSASCVMERVMLQSRFHHSSLGIRIENEALLSPVKESSM